MDISKFEAARRQLVTAIRLFFEDADSVSVYSLGHAAWEVLDSLCKHQGKMRFRELAAEANRLSEDEIKKLANFGKNFFKHADRKPDDVLADFSDEFNDHVLIAAAMDYSTVASTKPMEVQIYPLWYFAVYPEKAPLPHFQDIISAGDQMFPDLKVQNRAQQKAVGLDVLVQARGNRDLMSDPSTDRTAVRAIHARGST